MDYFEIKANHIKYVRDNLEPDWFYEKQAKALSGTQIYMLINFKSDRKLTDILKQYQDQEDLTFNKTEVLVKLAQFEMDRYISRSQAKRVLRNYQKFQVIILDFEGIRTVGQGFVDEVFYVFKNTHPEIEIQYRNANESVTFMIERGIKNRKSD